MSENYVTQKQLQTTLDEAFKKNNKLVVDEISEVVNDLIDRFDSRFLSLEEKFSKLEFETKSSINKLTNTIDGFVKRLEDYEVESRVRDAQFERLVIWAKEVSTKTGIPLPQL